MKNYCNSYALVEDLDKFSIDQGCVDTMVENY